MAQAFAQIHGAGKLEAYSAGSRPSGIVSPRAIASMKEIGYDLSVHRSKSINEYRDMHFDAVVTMGCGEECPLVSCRKHIEWQIPDPGNLSPIDFNKIRDMISLKVKDLILSLSTS